jgi:hypothetical protein
MRIACDSRACRPAVSGCLCELEVVLLRIPHLLDARFHNETQHHVVVR